MKVGWGGRDLQIHPVWAKASGVYDLRWIQIHGYMSRAQGAGETQGRIPEYFETILRLMTDFTGVFNK